MYVAAGSNPANFCIQLGSALQLIEQVPNPLALIYDYVLHFGGVFLAMALPTPSDAIPQTKHRLSFIQAQVLATCLQWAAVCALHTPTLCKWGL